MSRVSSVGGEQAYGQPPYWEDGPMEAMRAIVERPPPRLADLEVKRADMADGGEKKKNKKPKKPKKRKWSPEFEDFVAQCLAKDPDARPTGVLSSASSSAVRRPAAHRVS